MNHEDTKARRKRNRRFHRLREFEMQLVSLSAMLSSNFSFFWRVVMQRGERLVSPNIAIDIEKSSIPNLPQGACLAQEEGGNGGGTSGSARERGGSSPNKSSSAVQRTSSS